MKADYPEHWPQFYTATINNWQHLLADNTHKDIMPPPRLPTSGIATERRYYN